MNYDLEISLTSLISLQAGLSRCVSYQNANATLKMAIISFLAPRLLLRYAFEAACPSQSSTPLLTAWWTTPQLRVRSWGCGGGCTCCISSMRTSPRLYSSSSCSNNAKDDDWSSSASWEIVPSISCYCRSKYFSWNCCCFERQKDIAESDMPSSITCKKLCDVFCFSWIKMRFLKRIFLPIQPVA